MPAPASPFGPHKRPERKRISQDENGLIACKCDQPAFNCPVTTAGQNDYFMTVTRRSSCLGWSDAFGAGAFRSRTRRVGDFLSFLQLVEVHALDALGVKKQILVAIGLDESKTLVNGA